MGAVGVGLGEYLKSSPFDTQLLNIGASLVARQERILLQCRRRGFDPWVGKITWRRAWQPTPGFLPGESHGQRNLAG